MKLSPKKVKYTKMHIKKLTEKGISANRFLLSGNAGLRAIESFYLKSHQIEAARKIILKAIKNTGKLLIRVFPDRSITQRPSESRMGSGKGSVSDWYTLVKPGAIIFEISGISEEFASKVLNTARYKLPGHTNILIRSFDLNIF